MNEELQAIKAAMEAADFDQARALSDAYVTAHPEEFTKFEGMDLAEVVTAVEKARDVDHDEVKQYTAEAFHLYTWPGQTIGGAVVPEKRIH